MPTLSYSMDFRQWSNAFQTIKMRASNLTPAHEVIGDYIVAETVENIEQQGGAAYWRPLKKATLDRRHKEYPGSGDKMLIVTRALIESIAKDAHAAYVDVGSALKKARTLFFGRDNIPARFPFHWRAGVMDRVGRIYLEYLFTRLK